MSCFASDPQAPACVLCCTLYALFLFMPCHCCFWLRSSWKLPIGLACTYHTVYSIVYHTRRMMCPFANCTSPPPPPPSWKKTFHTPCTVTQKQQPTRLFYNTGVRSALLHLRRALFRVPFAAGGLPWSSRAGQGSPGVRGQLQASGHLHGVSGPGAHVVGRPASDEGHGDPHHGDSPGFQVRICGGAGGGFGEKRD